MKTLLAMLMVIGALSLDAQEVAFGRRKEDSSGGENIAADFHQTFELNSDNSAAQLDLSDGVAGANFDTTVDSESKLNCTSTSATKSMTSTVNGSTVTTTKGMAVTMDGASASYITFYLPSTQASISMGFWFYTPAQQNFNAFTFCRLFDTDGTATSILYGDPGADGGGATNIKFGSNTSLIAVSAGTWYWVTMQMVRNGTSSLSVYTDDTGATQVGATKTITSANFDWQYIRWGAVGAYGVATTAYFDNLLIDWTDATFPLVGQ